MGITKDFDEKRKRSKRGHFVKVRELQFVAALFYCSQNEMGFILFMHIAYVKVEITVTAPYDK